MALSDVSAKLELLAAVNKELSSVSDPFSKGPAYLAQTVVALNVTKVNFNVSQVQVRAAVLSLALLRASLLAKLLPLLLWLLPLLPRLLSHVVASSLLLLLLLVSLYFSPCYCLFLCFFCSLTLCASSDARLRPAFPASCSCTFTHSGAYVYWITSMSWVYV